MTFSFNGDTKKSKKNKNGYGFGIIDFFKKRIFRRKAEDEEKRKKKKRKIVLWCTLLPATIILIGCAVSLPLYFFYFKKSSGSKTIPIISLTASKDYLEKENDSSIITATLNVPGYVTFTSNANEHYVHFNDNLDNTATLTLVGLIMPGTPAITITASFDGAVNQDVTIDLITLSDVKNADGSDWIGYQSGSLHWNTDSIENTYTITGNEAYMVGNWTIPKYVTSDGNTIYKVISVGDNAFASESVSFINGTLRLPDSLISIGNKAFYNCRQMTGDLVIPDSVSSIGNESFSSCYSLNGSLKLSNKLETIGDKAFYADEYFANQQLTLPNTLLSIGSEAFYECKGFTGTLILSKNLANVKEKAFALCNGFTGLTFANFASPPGAWSSNNIFQMWRESGKVNVTGGTWSASAALTWATQRGLPTSWTN